jgi:hypothetical protein
MDFWKSQPRNDNHDDDRAPTSQPTLIEKLTEFAKDEAMSAAVEHLSGGWVTLENADDDEERPRNSRNQGSFEERLERELAKLAEQTQAGPPSATANIAPVAIDPPSPYPAAAAMPVPAPRPAYQGPRGFGRKGL